MVKEGIDLDHVYGSRRCRRESTTYVDLDFYGSVGRCAVAVKATLGCSDTFFSDTMNCWCEKNEVSCTRSDIGTDGYENEYRLNGAPLLYHNYAQENCVPRTE